MRRRSIRAGAVASLGLVAFYALVVAGASGSVGHLVDQAAADWFLLVPIVAGFGVQVALLAELRHRHRLHAEAVAAGGVGAGASTAGMVACCAHHLADLLPFAGATGAAAFLTDRRTTFMVVGVAVNAVAIAIATRRLRRVGAHIEEGAACAHV